MRNRHSLLYCDWLDGELHHLINQSDVSLTLVERQCSTFSSDMMQPQPWPPLSHGCFPAPDARYGEGKKCLVLSVLGKFFIQLIQIRQSLIAQSFVLFNLLLTFILSLQGLSVLLVPHHNLFHFFFVQSFQHRLPTIKLRITEQIPLKKHVGKKKFKMWIIGTLIVQNFTTWKIGTHSMQSKIERCLEEIT